MKSLFFILSLTWSIALIGQTELSDNNSILAAWCLKMDLHPDQVSSMLVNIVGEDNMHLEDLTSAFMNKTEAIRREGSILPMEDFDLLLWTESFGLSNEQAQDLYKVAIRFALQGERR